MFAVLATLFLAQKLANDAERKGHGARVGWLALLLGLSGLALGAFLARGTSIAQALGPVSGPYIVGLLGCALGNGVAALLGARLPQVGPASTERVQPFAELVWSRFVRHRLALLSAVVVVVLVESALFADLIELLLGVSHDYAHTTNRNAPAAWPHLLGTDELSRDVFTRLLFGGRISLSVGIISAASAAAIGTLIGTVAGYYGGVIDNALMRFTDAMLSVPVLPLMIVMSALDLQKLFGGERSVSGAIGVALSVGVVVVAARLVLERKSFGHGVFGAALKSGAIVSAVVLLGYATLFHVVDWKAVGTGNFSSVVKITLIIVFFGWMTVARLARAAALQLKEMEFVTAAAALGASDRRIMALHVLPNALAPIIVAATLEVGGNILYEAALSFLGLGIQPPV